VTLLLENNADVNVASSTTGVRPIHDAALHDYVDIADLLLTAGADPKLPTFSGKYPMGTSLRLQNIFEYATFVYYVIQFYIFGTHF